MGRMLNMDGRLNMDRKLCMDSELCVDKKLCVDSELFVDSELCVDGKLFVDSELCMDGELINEKDKTLKIVTLIEAYLKERDIDFENLEQLDRINARKNGEIYTIAQHVKGLIYSLLSNQRKWITMIPNLPAVDMLFFDYDAGMILEQPPEYFIEGIYKLKCGNISTQKQMNALHGNIRMLLFFNKEYGSIDSFYSNYSVNELALLLSDSGSAYKMKSVGYALAWQYLRNVGFDGAKPDVHLRRILGASRLNYGMHKIATEQEVLSSVERMSCDSGCSRSYINDLLWYFCSSGYGDVCSASPKCDSCVIRGYCCLGENFEISRGC